MPKIHAALFILIPLILIFWIFHTADAVFPYDDDTALGRPTEEQDNKSDNTQHQPPLRDDNPEEEDEYPDPSQPEEKPKPDEPHEQNGDELTPWQLSEIYTDTLFIRGSGDTMRIALTFDDGPDSQYTPKILDILEEYEVSATFFLEGEKAYKYPEVVTRIVQEGHTIGNHSWSHPRLTEISTEQFHDEVTKTEEILEEITGTRTAMLRPPFGRISEKELLKLKDMNYKIIQWSVDSRDWEVETSEEVIENVTRDLSNEAIVLFHSATGEEKSMSQTVDALPTLIEELRTEGYKLFTVDELLQIEPYKE